jgi:hypothetical protein
MSKTINEAMKDLITGLGADPSVLSDNSTVSDYIEDLTDAIKVGALPEVAAANNGQVLAVVNGAWTLCTMTAVADTTSGAVTFTFTPVANE